MNKVQMVLGVSALLTMASWIAFDDPIRDRGLAGCEIYIRPRDPNIKDVTVSFSETATGMDFYILPDAGVKVGVGDASGMAWHNMLPEDTESKLSFIHVDQGTPAPGDDELRVVLEGNQVASMNVPANRMIGRFTPPSIIATGPRGANYPGKRKAVIEFVYYDLPIRFTIFDSYP